MHFSPIYLTGTIFVLSLITSLFFLANKQVVKKIIRKYWRILFILVFINLAIKYPFGNKYFDGLEYEDSYIYKVSARTMYEGSYQYSKINPYYPTSCVFGSLKDCRQSAIFVTNFIGYPYLINLVYHLFGYHKNISNMVSLFFSGISIALIFFVALLIIDQLFFALICCFIYITIPIFNVYASTSLTEQLSNAYLVLVLLIYLAYIGSYQEGERARFQNMLGLSAIVFSMIFAILVKTTNISLVFCLPIAGLISYFKGGKDKGGNPRRRFVISLPFIFAIFFFSLLVLKFQTAVEINRGDIGINPFSISFLKTLAPIFTRSLFKLNWYLIYTIFFIFGLFLALRKKNGTYLVVIYLFYFVLYTLHYRSYYFTRGIPVFEDESIRYMMSFVSIYALIVGLGAYFLWDWIKIKTANWSFRIDGKLIIAFILFIGLGFSVFFTLKCRHYFYEDEQYVRVRPVTNVLDYIKDDKDVLITSEPILFQIYGGANLRIIDFCSIGILFSGKEVDTLIKNSRVYYLETISRDSIDQDRYRDQMRYIDTKPKEHVCVGQNFTLFRLLTE